MEDEAKKESPREEKALVTAKPAPRSSKAELPQ